MFGGVWGGLLLLAALFAGCEDDRYEGDPSPGNGLLIVDNFTGDRLRVYLNGVEAESVKRGHYRNYDLEPGVYRVALDSVSHWRSWAGDVDILVSRLTILEVRYDPADYRAFDVRQYFD